jgi:MtaA/CmuA family methyltransferase
MNSYERYFAVLKGDPVDFLPRTPILMHYAANYIGSDYAAFASDYRVLVKANITCAKDFGIDQLSCISDPYRETQGFGSEIEYVIDGPPRSTHPLQKSKDLSLLLQPDPYNSKRMADRINAVKSYYETYSKQYSILGWIEGPAAEAANLRDVIPFLTDLIEDESFIVDLMDLCVSAGIAFARAQVEAGADTIGIGDAIASQVSPDIYEKMIQPREKQLVRAIKDMGAHVKLHICGNITHLLPGISDLGVDILDVDHMVNIANVRTLIGNQVTITGNIDPVLGVQAGTPESIKQKIIEIYEAVGNPYMINAGCEIPVATATENLSALCEPVTYRS